MSYTKRLSFLLLTCALLLCVVGEAHGCECVPEPFPVNEAYDAARVIVIARVMSVKEADRDAVHGADRVSSAGMIVEQVFKGSVKVGDEMTFRQGSPGECVWAFNEQMIGRRYLLYLGSREEISKMWLVGVCGRSNHVDRAADDLLYLNRLDELRGRTRISGKIEFVGDDELSVSGRVIRLTGTNKVHEVKTDERGVYEILDLPPGTYLIEADTPPGWKVGGYFPRSYRRNYGVQGEDQSPKKFQIVLGDKKHVGFDISFEKDKAARGGN